MYRKLGKATKVRKALLRNQVTQLLYKGKIITTEARAKEVKKIVEPMIALAAKEKDNFDTVKVSAKVARKDADGRRVKEEKDGKKVTVYDTVEREIKKDQPSRMNARRKLLETLYPVKEVPAEGTGRKKNTKEIKLVDKLFDEYGPKYANRTGGYTRIIKIGPRKGDAAMMVVLELV
jgi:large subunit ribosomal protein L17